MDRENNTFREYNIKDFGAIEKDLISNSIAINKCIKLASLNGGGKVLFPKGLWFTGPIELCSNVQLFLAKDCYLKFLKNKEEYPLSYTSYEGVTSIRARSPIYANNCNNISICGEGIIDGSGDLWRPVKEAKVSKINWDRMKKNWGIVIDSNGKKLLCPTETISNGVINDTNGDFANKNIEELEEYYDYFRPVMVSLINCKNVILDGNTYINSPAWNIHMLYCSKVIVKNICVRNEEYAQNGDGLDIESCSDVEVYNSTFDVGDDGICIKSGKNKEARLIKKPSTNIYIHDCKVYHAHGGFVIGSEMSRGVNNIRVERCSFIGTSIGIRLKSAVGRGGVVSDIFIKDITMVDILNEAIVMTLNYVLYNLNNPDEDKLTAINPLDIPKFRDIRMSNISCYNAKIALKINGLSNSPIENIFLDDSYFVVDEGYEIKYGKSIYLRNVKISKKVTKETNFYESIELSDSL